MRSIVLALAFAAPLCAVAATPNYTNPLNSARNVKPQTVQVTFVSHTTQEREVWVGETHYHLHMNERIQVAVPVGEIVRVYSTQDSKLSGQPLLQASQTDANRTIVLN